MGQLQSSCCVARDDRPFVDISYSRSCCELNNSLLGEDAFYRDAFFDCNEGDRSHDRLFATAREQARLKYRKASNVKQYATWILGEKLACWLWGDRPSRCVVEARRSSSGQLQPAAPAFHRMDSPAEEDGSQGLQQGAEWLGKTLPEWRTDGLPSEGLFWKKGDGHGFRVRCGPDYLKTGQKCDSAGSLYEGVYCDALKADGKITDIMGRLVRLSDLPKPGKSEGDRSGGQLDWKKECGVPRILCINLMLPYQTGILGRGRSDEGCSFVGIFQVTSKALVAASNGKMSSSLKLWQQFCAGPCGAPGETGSKDRSLAARVAKGIKKDRQSGLFKAVAKCVNPQDVHVPDLFHTYNGKPCLITNCGYVVKDPDGEWLEVGIDVRGFNALARSMLCQFRGRLPICKIHYGFCIQSVDDDEMPEGLLCDMYVCGVDMISDPVPIRN
jgi:hypothetical protein